MVKLEIDISKEVKKEISNQVKKELEFGGLLRFVRDLVNQKFKQHTKVLQTKRHEAQIYHIKKRLDELERRLKIWKKLKIQKLK